MDLGSNIRRNLASPMIGMCVPFRVEDLTVVSVVDKMDTHRFSW